MEAPLYKTRSHNVSEILTNPKSDPKAKIQKLEADILETSQKRDATKPHLKTFQNLTDKLLRLTAELEELRNAPTPLSETFQSHLKQWMKQHLYGNKKPIYSPQIRKGNDCENEAIRLLGEHLGLSLVKNTKRAFNQYAEGESDVIHGRECWDTKVSYDEWTFPLFESEIPDSSYADQIQNYLWLYDLDRGHVAYVLCDAPEWMVEDEAWKECRRNGLDELDEDTYQAIKKRLTYSNRPIELRIKIFTFERDYTHPDKVVKRVLLGREYVKRMGFERLWKLTHLDAGMEII